MRMIGDKCKEGNPSVKLLSTGVEVSNSCAFYTRFGPSKLAAIFRHSTAQRFTILRGVSILHTDIARLHGGCRCVMIVSFLPEGTTTAVVLQTGPSFGRLLTRLQVDLDGKTNLAGIALKSTISGGQMDIGSKLYR
jgi:hypothetical protein